MVINQCFLKSVANLSGDKNEVDIKGGVFTTAKDGTSSGGVLTEIKTTGDDNAITLAGGIATKASNSKVTSATSGEYAATKVVATGAQNEIVIDGDISTTADNCNSGKASALTHIELAGEANKLTLTGDILTEGNKGVSEIILKGGESEVVINGSLNAKTSGQNLIDSNFIGAGKLDLLIEASSGADALNADSSAASTNTIKGGAGDDVIKIIGNVVGNNTIETGAGYDNVIINGDVSGLNLGTGVGDDIINITGNITNNTTINTGIGNDKFSIEGDISGLGLNTGIGDDIIKITGNITNNTIINTGTDNDTVSIAGDISGLGLDTGVGDDIIKITGNITNNTTINTGIGNDKFSIEGDISGLDLNMSRGNDIVSLSGTLSLEAGGRIEGGAGYDILKIGGLTSLDNVTISGQGTELKLSDLLGGSISGFEQLDLTGGAGTHLDIDILKLSSLSLDGQAKLPDFTFTSGSITGSLQSNNTFVIKGDTSDSVTLDSSQWGKVEGADLAPQNWSIL